MQLIARAEKERNWEMDHASWYAFIKERRSGCCV
jgi:hypothetical protein